MAREDTGGGGEAGKTNYWNAANISSNGIPSAFGGPERRSLEKYVNTRCCAIVHQEQLEQLDVWPTGQNDRPF